MMLVSRCMSTQSDKTTIFSMKMKVTATDECAVECAVEDNYSGTCTPLVPPKVS